jgi:hypothetical protein
MLENEDYWGNLATKYARTVQKMKRHGKPWILWQEKMIV